MTWQARQSLTGPIFIAVMALISARPLKAADAPTGTIALSNAVVAAVTAAFDRFGADGLRTNQLAVTACSLSATGVAAQADYRGQVRIYPASVVKLFYLVAAHQGLEDGRLQDSAELRRALRDMIVDSSNEATHYVLDLVTDTTSGPELPAAEMEVWVEKRNVVNRYFRSLGYLGINVNQKPWCEGPYGRERAFVGPNYDNRNMLTTDATARLVSAIATGEAVTAARSEEMLALMGRDFSLSTPATQANSYTGLGLPTGSALWSKAGWTSQVRHDAAYFQLPSGRRFVLVVFTTDHSNNKQIIGTIARTFVSLVEP